MIPLTYERTFLGECLIFEIIIFLWRFEIKPFEINFLPLEILFQMISYETFLKAKFGLIVRN